MQIVSFARYQKDALRPGNRLARKLVDWMRELDGRPVIGGKVWHNGHMLEIPERWRVRVSGGRKG